MYITIPLLLYTLVFGRHVNEASRWIAIPGTGLSFQTSDLAKIALITFLARSLSRKQENIKDVKQSFIPIMGAVCFGSNEKMLACMFGVCFNSLGQYVNRYYAVWRKYLAANYGSYQR